MTGSREINQTEYGEILSSAGTGGAEKPLTACLYYSHWVFFNRIRPLLVSPSL